MKIKTALLRNKVWQNIEKSVQYAKFGVKAFVCDPSMFQISQIYKSHYLLHIQMV